MKSFMQKAVLLILSVSFSTYLNAQQDLYKLTDESASESYEIQSIRADGSVLFNYVNLSERQDESVFIQIVGINPDTQKMCFVGYNYEIDEEGNRDLKINLQDAQEGLRSADYCYSLSFFDEVLKAEGRSFYLPKLDQGRVYTSVGTFLQMPVVFNEMGDWMILEPSPVKEVDNLNNNILWDRTDFTVTDAVVSVNPSYEYYFGLPIRTTMKKRDDSEVYGGIAQTKATLFSLLSTILDKDPWKNLVIESNFVLSPLYAAKNGLFPEDYLVKNGWTDAFFEFFQKNNLKVSVEDGFTIEEGAGRWYAIINRNNNMIGFYREVDAEHPPIDPVILFLPNTFSAIMSPDFIAWGANSELAKYFVLTISSAIQTNSLCAEEYLSNRYLKENRNFFFFYNPKIPSKLQFIDLYSKFISAYGLGICETNSCSYWIGNTGECASPKDEFVQGNIYLGLIKSRKVGLGKDI